MRMVQVSW